MVSQIISTCKVTDWDFLDIDNEALQLHNDWFHFRMCMPEKKYPWAVERDIQRLFLLSISLPSKVDAVQFMTENLGLELNAIHLELMDVFCYRTGIVEGDLDKLIDSSSAQSLLWFSLNTIERALLWDCPEPCWPSDLFHMMMELREILNSISLEECVLVDCAPLAPRWDYAYGDYIHAYYKFYNVCKQLEKNKLYSDLKTIAKQAHLALMHAVEEFYYWRFSDLPERVFLAKIDGIKKMETMWCISQVKANS